MIATGYRAGVLLRRWRKPAGGFDLPSPPTLSGQLLGRLIWSAAGAASSEPHRRLVACRTSVCRRSRRSAISPSVSGQPDLFKELAA